MEKYKAIQLMKEGKKLTHHNFATNEWMTIEGSKILLEDGVKCSQEEFWKWRTDLSWDDGYSIYQESNKVDKGVYLVKSTILEMPFFPKAKHEPKGHQRKYKYHK